MAGVLSEAILLHLSKKIDAAVYPINEFAIDLGFDTAAATAAAQMSIQSQDPTRKYKIILDKFVMRNGRDAQNLIDIFEEMNKKLLVDILKDAIEKERAQKQNQFKRIQAPRAVEDPGHTGTKGQGRHVTLQASQAPQQRPTSSSRDNNQSYPSPSNQISQNRLGAIAKENVQKSSKPEHYQEPTEAERREYTETEDCSPDVSLLVPQQRTESLNQNNPPPRPVPPPLNQAQNTLYWKLAAGFSTVVALLAVTVACKNLFYAGICAPSPCANGGTCEEHDGRYTCSCRTGYGGDTCEIEYIAEDFSLEDCQETLQRHYEEHLFKIQIKPWDPYDYVNLENYYTTVSLYKEDKNNIPDKPMQKSLLNGSVNDIFQTKVRGSLPERIVLFGEAGRGKTTAVAKMAYDWANKREDSPLKNVKLLFVIKMRELNIKTGITEAIVSLLGNKYKKYQRHLEDYIDSHEKDIVILFDGYDEFAGELDCRSNGGDVMDILCKKRCRRCRVLVTSRPVRIKDFNTRQVYYSKMVIEGYSQQHATGFINKFFLSDETKGKELKKYLEEDIVTNEMIATPLFCTMVCYLWNEGYIHGNFTRTKLFDDIMEFLRTHLNAKDEEDKEIEQDMLSDTVVSLGEVAYTKLSNKDDLNPLLLMDKDLSEVHDHKVDISFSLGLLTKDMKTDRQIIIYIEFFHKLAQEYSAGRYLASGIDAGRIVTDGFPEVVFDIKEILQFASGTSVFACRKIVTSLIDEGRRSAFANRNYLYHPIILDFISEAGTCADDSGPHLIPFLEDGKLQLRQVTASTVVGFDRLPGSVKQKITTIDISGTTSSPDLFVRLWNNIHTCINLRYMEMYRHVPPTISSRMNKLYQINSFTTSIQPPADDYVKIMEFLPNLNELIIYCDDFGDQSEFALTPEVFEKLWNQLESLTLLSRLSLPIPAGISFDLKPLASIRVFETDNVISVSSLVHVLTFLPKMRELIISEKEISELNYNSAAFCHLWDSLHTSPDLTQLFLPLPAPACIHCDLKPLQSVQVFETKSSSIDILTVLSKLPNLQKLYLYSDIPGYPEIDVKKAHKFFINLWSILLNYRDLHHLRLTIPSSVPTLHLDPLGSVETFQTKIKSQMDVFVILLSRLPNIMELDIFATNNYDRKFPEDVYYDKVVLAIVDGMVKNRIQPTVLNVTFDPRRKASNTVSRTSVEKFIQMLRTRGSMEKLEIVSFNYCVFNETDLVKITAAIREVTSITVFRIDCNLQPEGLLSRYAIQHDYKEEDTDNSEESGSLILTIFYRDEETNVRTEKSFMLPRLQ
ncbi:uncharacterized protein LOC121425107 isoform X2 [Lytechinus variegatus]|uniref:uncharacterized protein LOC121425107 isoform X2 n=1 Tax=Lytechinus variegatus TaxID=7654 RepID=UPI001BB229EC|nr:uncharacterized protein LOC121425107 isoform X2 [Lytechinus variegatus]